MVASAPHLFKHCNSKMFPAPLKCPEANRRASVSSREASPRLPLCFDLYGKYVCEHLRGIFEGLLLLLCVLWYLKLTKTTGLLSLLLLLPKPPPCSLCSNRSPLLSTWRVNNMRLFKAPPRHTRIMESWSRHLGCGPANIPGPVDPPVSCRCCCCTEEMRLFCSRLLLSFTAAH